MSQEWYDLDLEHFPLYEIAKDGRIRNRNTKKILKEQISAYGYRCLTLAGTDGKLHYRKTHVLVATRFIDNPNPNEYTYVNHIDQNRLNCNVENLEWTSPKKNASHGNAQEQRAQARTKLINEYDEKGCYLRTWVSSEAISKFYGVERSYATKACHNFKTIKCHHFRFYEYGTQDIDVSNHQYGGRTAKLLGKTEEVYGLPPIEYLYQVPCDEEIYNEIKEREQNKFVPSSKVIEDIRWLEQYTRHLEKRIAELKKSHT